MHTKFLKKALILSAFFVSGGAFAQTCSQVLPAGEPVTVRYVYDGDTVQLSNRSRVRLVGINTPEMDASLQAQRKLAAQARQYLTDWLEQRNYQVALVLAAEAKDSFGRQLGYLVDRKDSRHDAGAALLAQGYAHAVALGANTERLACYQALEALSRRQKQGVWQWRLQQAQAVQQEGFVLVRGVVTVRKRLKTTTVLVLDDQLVVLLRGAARESAAVEGQALEVRGWVRKKRFNLDGRRWSWQLRADHVFAVQQAGMN